MTMLVIFASSVRARHSSSSKVERNFAYSNFLLVELLFSPVFFAFVSKFLRGCSPPSYHIQSTWTSGVYCREQGISETLQYTVKLKHTFWSMNISKHLGNLINTLPILGLDMSPPGLCLETVLKRFHCRSRCFSAPRSSPGHDDYQY